LTDSGHRSELMIIYAEALPPDQLPAGVKNETPADEKFPHWSQFALGHARASLKIKHH
jgi:hypothetical protein